MKHKNISKQSNELLSFFNEKNKKCFMLNEAIEAFTTSKESAVRELVSDMTKRGLLMRLKESVYYIIPYEQDAKMFMPDWHLIAEFLINGSDFYIGYYSALQLHNLITQPSLKEQIVVTKQIRPTSIMIKNVPFQFIYHNKNHFFGIQKIWVDNYHQVNCSDLEKTIIDCLFKPDYAGGIVEIAKAIHLSQQKIDFQKLLDYSVNFQSQAVIKRLGYLLEILGIETNVIYELQKLKTDSFVPLDTELPKTGKMTSKWSIIQNLDLDTIKSAIFT